MGRTRAARCDGIPKPPARPALTVPDEPLSLSYAAADAIVLAADERQQVLAANTATARLRLVAGLVRRELTLLDHLPSLPDTTQHRTPSPN